MRTSPRMALQMIDRSVKYLGVIKDLIIIKVIKYMFSSNFVILKIEVDTKCPLILGRSFLTTSHMLIDVAKWKITVRVNDEENAMKHPLHPYNCLKAYVVDQMMERIDKNTSFSPVDQVILNVIKHLYEAQQSEIEECLTQLEFQNLASFLRKMEDEDKEIIKNKRQFVDKNMGIYK
ncbi:hypothetical protein CR513_25453, partial [Mucuna pruriens]